MPPENENLTSDTRFVTYFSAYEVRGYLLGLRQRGVARGTFKTS